MQVTNHINVRMTIHLHISHKNNNRHNHAITKIFNFKSKENESYIYQNIHAAIDSHIPNDSLNKIMNDFILMFS